MTFPVALPLLFSYALSFGAIFGGSASPLSARLAATIYERSILRTGTRVRLREALRGEAAG